MPLVGRNDLCRQEATDIVGQLELSEFFRILGNVPANKMKEWLTLRSNS